MNITIVAKITGVFLAVITSCAMATVPDRVIGTVIEDVRSSMADHPRFRNKLFAVDIDINREGATNELALWYVGELESHLAAVPGLRIVPGYIDRPRIRQSDALHSCAGITPDYVFTVESKSGVNGSLIEVRVAEADTGIGLSGYSWRYEGTLTAREHGLASRSGRIGSWGSPTRPVPLSNLPAMAQAIESEFLCKVHSAGFDLGGHTVLSELDSAFDQLEQVATTTERALQLSQGSVDGTQADYTLEVSASRRSSDLTQVVSLNFTLHQAASHRSVFHTVYAAVDSPETWWAMYTLGQLLNDMSAEDLHEEGERRYHAGDMEGSFFAHLGAGDKGHVRSLEWVGYFYENGAGVVANRAKALDAYRQAAEGGSQHAARRLAAISFEGERFDEARQWLEKIDQKEPADYFKLGFIYRSGVAGSPDLINAQANFSKVTGYDLVDDAIYELAQIERAKGNTRQYRRYIERSADMGHLESMNDLGVVLVQNKYRTKRKDGRRWFSRAAKKGDPRAMYNLALTYYQGIGVDKDKKRGKDWLERSAALGYGPAEDALDCDRRFTCKVRSDWSSSESSGGQALHSVVKTLATVISVGVAVAMTN